MLGANLADVRLKVSLSMHETEPAKSRFANKGGRDINFRVIEKTGSAVNTAITEVRAEPRATSL